jgi:hypothetical protein
MSEKVILVSLFAIEIPGYETHTNITKKQQHAWQEIRDKNTYTKERERERERETRQDNVKDVQGKGNEKIKR